MVDARVRNFAGGNNPDGIYSDGLDRHNLQPVLINELFRDWPRHPAAAERSSGWQASSGAAQGTDPRRLADR